MAFKIAFHGIAFRVHIAIPSSWKKKSKIALISETVWDRAKRLKFGTFFEHFENFKKHKFALISEMVRDGEKQMEFVDHHDHIYCQYLQQNCLQYFENLKKIKKNQKF